jgi:flagellar basal body-associated protein FliL
MIDERDEDNKEAAANEPQVKKKISIPLIVGVVASLVLLVGASVVAFIFFFSDEKQMDDNLALQSEEIVVEGYHDEDEWDEGEEALGAIFPLDTFIVNISESHYIRAQIQLEFFSRDISTRFYSRVVPIRNAIISLLMAQDKEELLTPRGQENLRIDIREKVNEVLRREEVKSVYFTQYVIQ